MAHVIARHGRPTLVMSHNKTLAAQLYGELKQLFPHNAVEYFISYYDYYQPEAYVLGIPTRPRQTRRSMASASPRPLRRFATPSRSRSRILNTLLERHDSSWWVYLT